MRQDIHPEYKETEFRCSCGTAYKIHSTLGEENREIEICGACHPFYTGEQKVIDTGGRLQRFKDRFGDL